MEIFDKDFITELVDEIREQVLDSIDIDRDTKRVYSGVEACEYLGITPPTLNNLVRKGFVKKRYMNGMERPCYLREDLDEYINESKRN